LVEMAIFSEFIEDIMEVFMDDFSVYGTNFDECLANLLKVLGGIEGVRSRFDVFAAGFILGGIEGAGSSLHVLRSLTHFRRFRGHGVMLSCFVLPEPFSAVPRAPSPAFMFCALGLGFGSTKGVGSHFHVLCYQTRFGRYRGCCVPFSYFALPDSFSAVSRVSSPIFMFCALGPVFAAIECAGSSFHILRSRTPFTVEPRASGPFFMFCAPGLVFDGTEGVESCFHILSSQTRFRRNRGRRVLFFMFCALGLIFGGTEGVGSRFNI
jgi:hypothetical protein